MRRRRSPLSNRSTLEIDSFTEPGQPADLESELDWPGSSGNCVVYVTSKPQHPDQLGHQLAMRVRAAAAHLRRRSNLTFATFGMTTDQYVLLTVLVEEGKMTQQELVAHCFSDTATIGAMVFLLETKGLVKRTPHPRDRRALSVSLTGAGRRLARQMRNSSAGVRADLMRLFSEQELATLMEFLARLAGAMRPTPRRTKISPRRRKVRAG